MLSTSRQKPQMDILAYSTQAVDSFFNLPTQSRRVNKATTTFADATAKQLFTAIIACFTRLPPTILAFAIFGILYTLWFVQSVAAIILTLAVVLAYTCYAKWVYHKWEAAFPGRRFTRCNKRSPSYRHLPDIRSMEANSKCILEKSRSLRNFDDCELIHSVNNSKTTKKKNKVSRDRASRIDALAPAKSAPLNGKLEEKEQHSLGKDKAPDLDMDHIFVKFSDFLWAYTFIGPFSYLLWLKGTTVLCFRKMLYKMGLINPKCDYETLAAALLLEQTQAIHYHARWKQDDKNIAGFVFADFPYVDDNCDMKVADLFTVAIDLDTKRFVKAKLDCETITAKEAVTLLWYNTIAAQHVKLHAMANWGVNVDDSLKGANDFLRRNSVVTAMYNFFGYTSFNGFLKIWAKQGLVSDGWTKPNAPLVQSFNHGIKSNILQHVGIEELAKYSRFVKFTIKVRAIFLYEFQKHEDLFPGVDGEALFVGTVLHSLDHTFMEWNLKDALYLDTSDNRFGKMAEIGQVVKVGFVSDVDGLYFHKRFKNSGHPFYDVVYKKAAKIDKLLADNMDTCIIK